MTTKSLKLIILSLVLILSSQTISFADEAAQVEAPSYVLMDAKTGTVLLSKDENAKRPIASITKVMTLSIIFDEIRAGNLKMTDIIKASAEAAKMGGSQIYLKENEEMDVNMLLKAIFVGSANDASYAMAEHISGSVTTFVQRMNDKASELGMKNTHFMNPHGLDEDNHYSSALDVSIMSRYLMKNPEVTNYTTIWQEKIRNNTFELTNTNKLVRTYDGITGLKTGSTSKAGFCLSATATRNNLDLLSVTLASTSGANRFKDGKSLLDYGFKNYKMHTLASVNDIIAEGEVHFGKSKNVELSPKEDLQQLIKANDKMQVETKVDITKQKAPIKKGDKFGTITFTKNGETVAQTDLVAKKDVDKLTFFDIINKFLEQI